MAAEAAPGGPPRPRLGPEPQRLLVIALGDYWYWRSEPIPSQALIAVLGEFGITPASARAAMRRLAQRGLVRRTKSGRTTADGVAYPGPGDARAARGRLGGGLRVRGCGRLWCGVWVAPRDRRAAARAARGRHGVDAAAVFRTGLEGMRPEAIVARAFDLRAP